MTTTKTSNVDPEARFWMDATIASAKSACLIATGGIEASDGQIPSSAVSTYYGVLHLGMALMWLKPGLIDPTLLAKLAPKRDSGASLPDRSLSHTKIDEFVQAQQTALGTPAFGVLFTELRELREFVSYGPRGIIKNDVPTVVCERFKPSDAASLNSRARSVFVDSMRTVSPTSGYSGNLAPIVRDQANGLLKDLQFPFLGWYRADALSEASKLLASI